MAKRFIIYGQENEHPDGDWVIVAKAGSMKAAIAYCQKIEAGDSRYINSNSDRIYLCIEQEISG